MPRGLRYVSDADPGLGRVPHGAKFRYVAADGTPVRDAATLRRIRKLAIPPAYTDVWISPDPRGHIQATGRDARGRKQYRYHVDWRAIRDQTKFERLVAFARGLPALRERLKSDMARHGLPREKVLATVVWLLETTLARVGNEEYAKQNKSYGLTTLRNRHVAVDGDELRFQFKGKSGKQWRVSLQDRRVAKIVRSCQELPGQSLFQYRTADGEAQSVTSADVNDYLREITGEEVTAKDFRTWAGTVLAALELAAMPGETTRTALKRQQRDAILRTAARLGNTPTICRKCYVHPNILDGHLAGALALKIEEVAGETPALRPEETAVLGFLEQGAKAVVRARRKGRAGAEGVAIPA